MQYDAIAQPSPSDRRIPTETSIGSQNVLTEYTVYTLEVLTTQNDTIYATLGGQATRLRGLGLGEPSVKEPLDLLQASHEAERVQALQ